MTRKSDSSSKADGTNSRRLTVPIHLAVVACQLNGTVVIIYWGIKYQMRGWQEKGSRRMNYSGPREINPLRNAYHPFSPGLQYGVLERHHRLHILKVKH